MRFLDLPLLILCITAAAYLVMPWTVRRKEKLRQSTTRVVLLGILLSLAWTVVLGLERAQSLRLITGFDGYALARLAIYILVLLAALFFQLTRSFLRRVGAGHARLSSLAWWGICGGFLLPGVLLYENPLRLRDALFSVGGVNYMRWDVAFLILAAGWGFFIGGAVLHTRHEYSQRISPLHRNRGKYWSLMLILVVFAGGLALAQQTLAAAVLNLLAMTIILVLLLTYNLPDIRLALRAMARYTITTLITTLVYAAGFFAAQFLLRANIANTAAAVALGMAALLAVLFNPLLRGIDGLVQRLVSGAQYDSRQALSDYSLSISNVLDMELLSAIAIGLISEAMDITHGALATVTSAADFDRSENAPQSPRREGVLSKTEAVDKAAQMTGASETSEESRAAGASVAAVAAVAAGAAGAAGAAAAAGAAVAEPAPAQAGEVYLLRPTSGTGEVLPIGRLTLKNPAAAFLRREHHPLTQYDIDLLPRFQEMPEEERAWLSALQMDIFIPIYAKENWIGLLALGPKVSGDRYFDEDLAFLQTLADQTAVALENARLYENLKQRNTENERLNTRLKAANEELARLDQAKTDFINIASHELRTPLTQVMGYNEILTEMMKADPAEQETGLQMTEAVSKAAHRLEEIVETMFDVTKIETNTLDLQPGPVTPQTIINVAVENWQRGMKERSISVVVSGISSLPTIYADGKRMAQVFSNLVQNAIKSTHDGGQIVITGRVIEADDLPYPPGERCIEIIISDTGIGIAVDELERIFNKFYRVGNVLRHSTGETKFKGAGPGLGLSIARGIVEAHGGRIWAESQGYDEAACPGARFHVLLPIQPLNR